MSNNDDDNDSRALSGLYNLGNTCYMNATLQCLFATDIFNYYLKKTKFKKDLKYGIINIEIDKCKNILKLNPHITLEQLTEFINSKRAMLKENFKNSLTYSLYQVFSLMWNSNCIIKPKKLKHIIGIFCPKFEGYQQHDSEELLYGLFDRIHDETKSEVKIKKFKVSHETSEYFGKKRAILNMIKEEPDNEIHKIRLNNLVSQNYNSDVIVGSLEYWKNYLDGNNSIISKIFTGMFSSEIICKNCNNKNINFETFNILELSLTDKNGNIINNLEECLIHFCELEEVDDYNCDRCKSKTVALKKMSVFQLPPKLIIQLKRFSKNKEFRGRGNSKIDDLIKFPLTNLDMSIVENEIKPITDKYNLYATVNHSGGLNGGHYVANCKNLLDKKWYHFNDSNVSYVNDEREIIDDSAYILFYEKA
jgi:ubiquitin carboxyl-terminal hydrolase 8